jgi:NDP-sugar pyrophosphorylase family protein
VNVIRHALIMAAGRGRRMMPLTDVIPKPMAPYLDSTLIGTGIAKIRKHIENIHVTVGYKGAMLAQHLVDVGVRTIINTEGKSNSWWLYHSLLHQLDEPIFVLTCDNVTEIDFESLEADYLAQGSPPCMLVPVKPVDGLEGDYISCEDRVVTDLDRSRPTDIYCSGIQVLNPRRINQLTREGNDFYDVWRQLIEQRLLLISSMRPDRWFSIDTIADLQRATKASG